VNHNVVRVGLAAVAALIGCSASVLSQEAGHIPSHNSDPIVQKLLNEHRATSLAWMEGDSAPVAATMAHTDAFTIFGPFGTVGATGWSENFARAQVTAAAQFQGATYSTVELVQSHVSDGLIVLVTLEKNLVRLAGSEPQQWDLRVTQVYEKDGAEWKIVHRHADPLVIRRNLTQTLGLFNP
jgi:ketosteroid isomerase-like protein